MPQLKLFLDIDKSLRPPSTNLTISLYLVLGMIKSLLLLYNSNNLSCHLDNLKK